MLYYDKSIRSVGVFGRYKSETFILIEVYYVMSERVFTIIFFFFFFWFKLYIK